MIVKIKVILYTYYIDYLNERRKILVELLDYKIIL